MGRKHRKCIICSKNEFNMDFFAALPMDEERCKEWVRVIGNEDLVQIPIEKLNQLRFVCGDHFEKKLFSNKGMKRLKKGAVPSLNLTAAPLTAEQLIGFPQHLESPRKSVGETLKSNSNLFGTNLIIINEDHNSFNFEPVEEENHLENMQICRACLVTNVKMYDMKSLPILTAYLELTGISDFGSYTHICYECAARLRRCEGFRLNCFKADETLKQMITKSVLRKDRKQKGLESPLQITPVTIVDFNNQAPTITEAIVKPIKVEIICEEPLFENHFVKTETDNTNNSDTEVKIDFTTEDNDVSSDFEIVQPYDNSCEVKAENLKEIKLNRESAKRKKSLETDESEDDDAPLVKLSKTQKKRVTKPKEKGAMMKKNNRIKLDPKIFEEYATVVLLTPEDAKKEVELRKESKNYKECPFKCDSCYRGYELENTFNNHMKKHNLSYGSFSCEFCRLRFPKRHELGKHVMSCHRRKFLCNLCPFICFSVTRAKIHMSLHKGVKYTCEECGLTFRMPNTLLKHKREKHSKQCVCGICGSTFVNERGLHAHNKLIHKQDVNLKQGPVCTECDIHFSTELAWKRHLVLSSKHQVSNGCETCGETFDSDESLKTHLKIHVRKRIRGDDLLLPASCTLCTKWLTSRAEFKSHMTSQHPECDVTRRIEQECPYVCEFCGKRFQYRMHMFKHQRKHTGERPYSCSVCNRQFAFSSSLTSHRETHSANRRLRKCGTCHKEFKTKYAHAKHVVKCKENMTSHPNCDVTRLAGDDDMPCICEFCGKKFKKPSSVLCHRRKHTGEKPYACNICGKAFALRSGLSAHKKIHNPMRPAKPISACDMCDKMFKSKSALIKHIRVGHLNIRPHSCDLCGKSYHNLCDVKYHKQHAHDNVPWPKRDRSKRKANEEQSDLIIDSN